MEGGRKVKVEDNTQFDPDNITLTSYNYHGRMEEGIEFKTEEEERLEMAGDEEEVKPSLAVFLQPFEELNYDSEEQGKQCFFQEDYQNPAYRIPTTWAEHLLHYTQSSDSNRRMDKKKALRRERDQRYRDRHREDLNQRRRDQRRYQRSLQPIARSNVRSIEPMQYEEVSNKKVDKKRAMRRVRDQRYRDRHREDLNQRRRDQRRYQRSLQPIASSNVRSIEPMQHEEVSNKKADKRNVPRKERDQRYRERHREEINKRKRKRHQQNVQHINSMHERDHIHVNEAQLYPIAYNILNSNLDFQLVMVEYSCVHV